MNDDILTLLEKQSDKNLITYNGRTETQKTFCHYTEQLHKQIKEIPELKTSDFVMIRNEDPIVFYALLFALWQNGNKVIFPTRDYLADKQAIDYYQFEVNCPNDCVLIEKNDHYISVTMDPEGDTVLFSSGSTGTPKGILHRRNHFLSNASAVAEVVTTKGLTNISCLKPYLISAFSHFLVHYLTDSHLIFLDYDQINTMDGFFRNQKDIGIVGSPMHIITSMNYLPDHTAPRIFFSSGDFISANTISNVMNHLPNIIYYNVYGLAELAGRFFINKIDSNTPISSYESTGYNINGTHYSIHDSQLHVKSDFLFLGYIRNNSFEPSMESHPTGDLAYYKGENLFLYGRANDEIKVLGNKVALKHVENKIKNILNQDTAILISVPHPTFGNVLALLLKSEKALQRQVLIRKLRTDLSLHEIPHQFYYIDDIPFTQSLKIDRNKILGRISSLQRIS